MGYLKKVRQVAELYQLMGVSTNIFRTPENNADWFVRWPFEKYSELFSKGKKGRNKESGSACNISID